jgi:WD40 repeat protein
VRPPQWAPNGRIIVTNQDRRVQGWDVASRKLIWQFNPAGSPQLTVIQLSPCGNKILVCSEKRQAEIWGDKTSLNKDQSLLFLKVFSIDRLKPEEIANLRHIYAGLSAEDQAVIDKKTDNAFSLPMEPGVEETKAQEPKPPKPCTSGADARLL